MNKKITWVGAFVLASLGVFAQENDSIRNLDEVVISDSKFALPKEKSGKVVVKISAEDLKKRQGQSLAAVLSTVAGLEINGNQSRNGKDLGYFIRGGRNHQTLILIDGIPVTDASGISLSFDLRLLPVEQVESIEIMKGASSTLYGTGAATGVINITLKKAAKKSFQGNAYLNMGTQETVNHKHNYEPAEFNQGFSVGGTLEKFNYSAALNTTYANGISEAKPANENTLFEDDAFSRVNSVVKVGFTPTKKLSFDFFANYDRMKNEFDNGSFTDNTSNFSTSEQYRVGFSPKYKYSKGEFVINSGANLITRDFFSYGSPSEYKSRSVNSDVFNKYEVSKQFFVVTGTQIQFHDMSNWSPYGSIAKEYARFNMIDPYATVVYNSDFGFNLNAGARYNIHNRFGNNLVYNVNPSYSLFDSKLKVLASYSTAFVTPSLYQLYSPYGDGNLNAEEDATVEAGFEVNLLDKKVSINAVAFHREEKNAIGFDLITYKYFNVDGINNVKGVETMVSYALNDKIKFNANYTFTELQKQSRILNPKHKANASVDFTATSRLGINLAYQFVDKRITEYTVYDPITWTPTLVRETLKDYQLVNANVRYALVKNRVNTFLAVDNVLNKDFVEARGYSTRGRNFKIGFSFLF
ncbi:TonB-dependent receptor [Flavobacterium amniphilum]|uniref:TonB-dependent receptor plug domain-containing protein n=1 Tax=Flavobacterium amniphilum TaxID=1834035 RepID=UPI00202A3FD5|nr:TonB-dependent receptor plug domain-containing protein [Flavobacterium amniphilum]MCL9807229.1 TonB-dependent receptor [Flavobacterium amniphilum]